jgi:parvulin-like peptidyl-prolyl isomerase
MKTLFQHKILPSTTFQENVDNQVPKNINKNKGILRIPVFESENLACLSHILIKSSPQRRDLKYGYKYNFSEFFDNLARDANMMANEKPA